MILTWLRKNLFRSATDSVLTVVFGALTIWALYRTLRFIFVTGRWDVVRENLSLFLTGSWPEDQLNRLATVLVALTFIGAVGIGFAIRRSRDAPDAPAPLTGGPKWRDLLLRFWPAIVVTILMLLLTSTAGPWLLVGALIVAGVAGRVLGGLIPIGTSPPVVVGLLTLALASIWYLNAGVGWNDWGGLLLNVFFAAISIALCFPIGVLLALGRRSEYPIVRGICTVYIELFRGVPLVALLLMANVALGFFIPQSLAPGKIVRAIIIFILFTSAYVAEIVRGGLQSVPKGQVEAGKANGLSPIPIVTRIVLPQAIRNVIPALVGQFISLFKDTTLAGVAMGVTDLLVAAEASTAQEAFRGQGLIAETLMFALLLFWAGSYTMSQESQRLETRLGVGQR
jgi:general L-amino acid transport system permease protein